MVVWRASRSGLRAKKGAIVELYQRPPTESIVVCLDQLGPTAGKKNVGKEVVYALGKEERPVQRAKVEVDDEHHGKGYVFGAFRPATGEAFTAGYTSRTAKNWIEFLEQVDAWVGPEVKQVYAILDNLGMHKGTNALLFARAHPRWEFVFQPTRAAYLNLIEPWWKNLRSLAFSGHCFESKEASGSPFAWHCSGGCSPVVLSGCTNYAVSKINTDYEIGPSTVTLSRSEGSRDHRP